MTGWQRHYQLSSYRRRWQQIELTLDIGAVEPIGESILTQLSLSIIRK